MKRREFITLPAATLGGVLIYTLAKEPIRLQAQDGEVRVPLRFFTAEEARVVAAACERIFPSDENGPGAKEAGSVIYIDRQLAGPYGRDKYRYTKGPWVCTKEAIAFSGLKAIRQGRNRHRRRFGRPGEGAGQVSATSTGSRIALASDETKKMLEAYGVWGEKSMYGRKFMGVRPHHRPDRAGRAHRAGVGERQSRGPRRGRCSRPPRRSEFCFGVLVRTGMAAWRGVMLSPATGARTCVSNPLTARRAILGFRGKLTM